MVWSVCACILFNCTATTEIYSLSLHDALPIFHRSDRSSPRTAGTYWCGSIYAPAPAGTSCRRSARSEEHTSELQSRQYLACCLLLEKKNSMYMMSLRALFVF